MDASRIARVAHEADRALAAVQGRMDQRTWFALEARDRANLVTGVQVALDTPRATAADLHAAWLSDKREAGWRWGPAFDRTAQTDPLMIPWDQLSVPAQARELLFVATVRSLSAHR